MSISYNPKSTNHNPELKDKKKTFRYTLKIKKSKINREKQTKKTKA